MHTDSHFLKTVSWPPSRWGFWCMASLWGIWLSSRCYASCAPTLKTCVCPGIILNRSSESSWLLWSPLVKTVISHFHCFWDSVLNWSWPLKWQIVDKKKIQVHLILLCRVWLAQLLPDCWKHKIDRRFRNSPLAVH